MHHYLKVTGSAEQALHAFSEFLESRYTLVETSDQKHICASGPLVLMSWDRRAFSRGNFVGVNPLVLVSSAEATSRDTPTGASLKVSLTSYRIYWFPLLGLCVGVIAWSDGAPPFALVFLGCVVSGYIAISWWLLARGFVRELAALLGERGLTTRSSLP